MNLQVLQRSPIVGKELRPLLRSQRGFWLMLLALLAAGVGVLAIWLERGGAHDISDATRLGRSLFEMSALTLLCALGLLAALITATALTSERENNTFDLLVNTGLSRPRILRGKLFAALGYQSLVVLCMLPILILPFLLGGIGFDEVILSFIIIAAAVPTYGMLGLAVSCRLRRSLPALILALILAVAIGLAIPVGCILLYQSMSGSDDLNRKVLEPILTISPFAAMAMLFDNNHSSAPTMAAAGASAFSELLRVAGEARLGRYFFLQAQQFLLFWLLALQGLSGRRVERFFVAPRLIDDPAELKRRRRHWPFYLIDPLRRPREIPLISDRSNPVFVRERHTGFLLGTATLRRFCYAGAIVAFFMTLGLINGEDIPFPLAVLTLLIPAAPLVLLQSSTILSRERAENTLDLLRVTPLTPGVIIWGKYAAVMRFVLILATSALVTGLLHSLTWFMAARVPVFRFIETFNPFRGMDLFTRALLFALASCALLAALGLYASARCRRGLTSILLGLGLVSAFCLTPYVAEVSNEIAKEFIVIGKSEDPRDDHPPKFSWADSTPCFVIETLVHDAGPALSVPYYLLNTPRESDSGYPSEPEFLKHGWRRSDTWLKVLLHAILSLLLAGFILCRAARRLAKKERK